MAFTPESIAAAYQQAVAAGISPETFAQVAQRDYGVTPGQLVAAQATLVGADNPVVQNNLRALPQQEVVNYLRASSPTRINVTGVENQGEGGGMVYTAPGGLAGGGNMLRPTYRAGSGEGAVDTLTGFTRPLTPEFDPTYAGGQFGNYVGVYDPQGNLVDIRFQQQERHGGFLSENLDWIGPLVVGGAALAGGLLGGASSAGLGGSGAAGAGGAGGPTAASLGGLDLVGSDWALGALTGPPGGLLPTVAGTGLTAANLGAAAGAVGTAGALAGAAQTARDVRDVTRTGRDLIDLTGDREADTGGRTGVADENARLRDQIDRALRDAGLDGGTENDSQDISDEEYRRRIDEALRDSGYDLNYDQYREIVEDINNQRDTFRRELEDINRQRQQLERERQGGGSNQGNTTRPPGTTDTTNWGQIIGQLANVLGGANAANAAREAAQIQAGLGREALGLQREMFERQVGLQEPFRQGGLAAQNRLMDLLGLGYSPEQLATMYRDRVGQGGATEADFVNWARSQGVSDPRLMEARNMLLGRTPDALAQAYRERVGTGGMSEADFVNWARGQGYSDSMMGQARNMLLGRTQPGGGTIMSDFGSAARPFSMDAFRADPGYGFRLSEGLKALERSQAARGGLMSGGTGKALQRFGQDMASQEYGNAFNRFYTEREALLNPLLSLSGRGQTSATQTGQAAQQFGQQGAQSLTGIGNAMAAGQVGQANAINQAIGQGVSMYNQGQNQNLLNQVLARSMG